MASPRGRNSLLFKPLKKRRLLFALVDKQGQITGPGDALCEVETDKATLPWETVDEGYVAKFLVSLYIYI